MATATWRIDSNTSSLRFSVRHLLVSRTDGQFRRFSGTLAFDDEHPEGATVDVRVEAASIDTGERSRDDELRDFLEVAKHSELRFRSTGVTRKGGKRYQVRGELTVRDVTRDVVLDVEDQGRSGTSHARFSARATLDRRDFGLRWNRAIEAGGVLVGDKIDVSIAVQAERVAA